MRRLSVLGVLTAIMVSATTVPAYAGGTARTAGLHLESAAVRGFAGSPGVAARNAMRYGYLVPDRAAYLSQKARAAARAGVRVANSTALSGPLAPTTSHSFQGLTDTCGTPPDTVSAVGTGRFIETVNCTFGIYSKTGTAPMSTGSLNSLVGVSSTDSVFDPQIIWDPGAKRFFYAADDVVSSTQNQLALGWSTTATPSSASDWCKYVINYGSLFPDFPKLGDTKDFVLIGANVFNGNTYVRSDVAWVAKPPSGTTCPSAGSVVSGVKTGLLGPDGKAAFTPVPANQTDTAGSGWIVARSFSLPGTFLSLFKVTKDSLGHAVIPTTGKQVTVPSYNFPANAPQSGATQVLDTSDARPWGVVSAVDPAHGSVALWVQHTVAGGAGAQVRWYEIDPVARTLFQSGSVTNATAFKFNGAISPDRVRNGSTSAFGSDMVLTFSSSSSSTFPSVRAVSKIGTAAQSGELVLVTSAGPMIDFSCKTTGSTCRWGDYAGATPDPSASTLGSTGTVWITNEWNRISSSHTVANWLTWNAAITP